LAHKIFGKPIVWLKTAHTFPPEAQLAEYTKSIEDLLIEEGLVTHEQIVRALKLEKAGSAPLCLLRMGLLDEKQFTSIWAKHSGLAIRLIDPDQISTSILQRFPESQSLHFEAIPVAEVDHRLLVVFREPPDSARLAEISRDMHMAVQPFLGPPSSIAFARSRAYPRLVLPPSRFTNVAERLKQSGTAEPAALLGASIDQEVSGRSLFDILVDRGVLETGEARRLWAECLGCPPFEGSELNLNLAFFQRVGPAFWWLHRMLPAVSDIIVTGSPLHPEIQQWLEEKNSGNQPTFRAELPRSLELVARAQTLEIDPDRLLIDWLEAKEFLPKRELANITALRQLTSDSASKWLVLQQWVSPEQVYLGFIEICKLPVAQAWSRAEMKRLMPIFPPGFAHENACYPLHESNGALRLGLGQMPSSAALRQIHTRLAGYPLFFQALTYPDLQELKALAT
jgi:hypothetical protein